MQHNRVFVHIPYKEIMENFAKIERKEFNIELCVSSEMIDHAPPEKIEQIHSLLKGKNRECTFHAPYRDLNPGSFDNAIREVTLQRFYKTLELAAKFEPKAIVFHTGFDPRKFVGFEKEWLDVSIRSWNEVLKRAEGLSAKLALENVFEFNPQQIVSILKEFESDLGFCLDVGHIHVFSRNSLNDWFDQLAKYLVEIHLHDNNGEYDQHLAMGEGTFPFDELLSLLEQYHSTPLFTIEGGDEVAIKESLNYIGKYFIKQP